jgi:drug/metabolite transporter (DMT)-like permease
MKNNKAVITYLWILLSMIFWGMSFVWTSIVFTCYPPITTIFLRLGLSSLLLMGGLVMFRKIERIRKKDVGLFLLSALFNPFLYFIGENFGLKHTSPSISAVVIATIPLFTPVAAYLIVRERISWLNIAGIILSFTGILIMLISRDMTFAASPAGVGFLFFAVISAVIYSSFLKKLTARYGPFSIIAWQNLIGAIYFLPLFLILDLKEFLTIRPDWKAVTALFQLAVFASTLAYVLFTIGVKKIGVSRTNVFTNLIPIFTATFSYFILAENFNIQKISGILVVISGVALTQIQHFTGMNPRVSR